MTQEEIDAAIGRLVNTHKAKRTECAGIKASLRELVSSMRVVVDAALSQDRFEPERIRRADVPDDGWSLLPQLLDDLATCSAELRDIEAHLKEADLAYFIKGT